MASIKMLFIAAYAFAVFSVSLASMDAHQPVMATSQTRNTFCASLSKLHPAILSFPGDAAYEIEQESYFSLFQSQLKPACRVTPNSVDDLQNVYLELIKSSIPFAIRAGGHSWNTGFSNTNGTGVTIDLTRFKKLELGSDRRTVFLGAGLRWGEVYDYLEPMGLTAPGGRDADVGVSGFILGGGISWISNHLGWTIDALVGVKIMLPSGEIVIANEKDHSNLFWALKGSGGAVGIVIEFELLVREQTEFYGGIISYSTDQLDAMVEEIVSIANQADKTPDSVAYFGGGLVGTEGQVGWSAILANLNGTHASIPLQRLEHVPHTFQNTGTRNVSTLAKTMHDGNPIGFRQVKSTFTFTMSVEVIKNLVQAFLRQVGDVRLDTDDSWLAVGFQPLTAVHLHHRDNLLGLWQVNQAPLILFSIEARWQDSTMDNYMFALVKGIHNKLRQLIGSSEHPFQYANYANVDWQDPISSYGQRAVRDLRQVQQKYDPDRVFSRLRQSGWRYPDPVFYQLRTV